MIKDKSKKGISYNKRRYVRRMFRYLKTTSLVAMGIALISATSYCNAQGRPAVGMPAPQITFDQIISGDSTDALPTLEKVKGKVVVIEFTASWCGPCIAALPHWNKLIKSVEGKPVVFYSVSNESETACRRLIANNTFRSIFARDADGSTFADYWVAAVPLSVVIDKQGKIAAITHPTSLETKHLEAVLKGEKIDLPQPNLKRTNWDARPPHERSGATQGQADFKPMAYAYILPTSGEVKQNFDPDEASISYIWTLENLIAQAYLVPAAYHDFQIKLPLDQTYEVYVKAPLTPDGNPMTQALLGLQKLLEGTFGYVTAWEPHEADVLVLQLKAGSKGPEAVKADGPPSTSVLPGYLFMQKAPFKLALFRMVPLMPESLPIVDETGLTGAYNLEAKWDAKKESLEDLNKSFEPFGLEFVKAKRTVKMLVFKKAPLPSPFAPK